MNLENIIIDINEDDIPDDILSILLKDRTTGKNIIWATNVFDRRDSDGKELDGYQFFDEITVPKITKENNQVIRPRVTKSITEQLSRSQEKGEVFTPAWVCNRQNNQIDTIWFGRNDVFNQEINNGWTTNVEPIEFPEVKGKSWQNYIQELKIEICCGEAPYLVSRFDVTTKKPIPVIDRIGLLDRKLRVINENTPKEKSKTNHRTWLRWVQKAYASTYGFEWQGDNIVLAREALLLTFIENYVFKWGNHPQPSALEKIANIISWNIWQMDGITFGIPGYEVKEELPDKVLSIQYELEEVNNNQRLCRVMEWSSFEPLEGKKVIFKSLIS